MGGKYTKTTWVNGTAPAINATNLNKIESAIEDNTNNIGRVQSEFDFAGAAISNLDESSGSITITAGQTSGYTKKIYTPVDLREWRNFKLTVSDLSASNNLYYTIRDSADTTDIVAQTEITENGINVIDLTSISIATYPSILIRLDLARDTTGDTSPTVENFSTTWEGLEKGVWHELDSDTLSSAVATLSIDASSYNFDEFKVVANIGSASVTASGLVTQINSDTGSNYDFCIEQIGDTGDLRDPTATYIEVVRPNNFSSDYNYDIEIIVEPPNDLHNYYQIKTEANSALLNRARNFIGRGFYNSTSDFASLQLKIIAAYNIASGTKWKLYGRNWK